EVQETANLLGISKRAVQKNINKGKFKAIVTTGRGGKRYLIALSSLPPEARLRYMKEQGILESLRTESPVVAQPLPLPKVPEKHKKIALARLDLVRLWRQFRQGEGKKTEADRVFIEAYNKGSLAPNIYEILGEVSAKTLYRWIDALEGSEDYTKLIPKWNPGSNGYKLTKEEESAVLRFLLDPKKIKIGKAIKLAKFYLTQKGIPSEAHPITFRRFIEKWKSQNMDKWILAREGQKALKDRLLPYILRQPEVLEVGEVLVADGHRLNFQVINPFTGKPCRAVLLGYLDWKSFALVGYEVMLQENIQCIASALRNAILRLGKIPKIVYQDNGKAFRARFFTGSPDFNESGLYGLFARLGIVAEFALPYNARA
ncbi:MAG: helix-turn-helix domain-containing protein, partial [Hydrogenobacter thermophilus]|nr:helix-turn-helix domain-containing protein [Hydrogenobacter thermophilus]